VGKLGTEDCFDQCREPGERNLSNDQDTQAGRKSWIDSSQGQDNFYLQKRPDSWAHSASYSLAQQPCMGLGLLLPPLFEVTKSCAFMAVGDRPASRA
jgi:hypothetical protein